MVIVVLITVTLSCSKSFLEVEPKGKLVAKKVADYDLLLNNPDLFNLIFSNAQVPMGDEVVAIEPYFSGTDLKTQRLFKWNDVTYEPAENAGELTAPLKNIYTYNKIINELPDATEGSDAQRRSIMAEALVGRAWAYFLLINYFGKPYNPATAATDPGVPIVKVADVTQTKFTRASVKEVYDLIVSDLTTAIPDLPEKITSRIRIAKPTAEGLLGKVYTFMGRFNEAIPHFDAAITGIAKSTVPVRLYDYNVTFAPGGQFTPVDEFGPKYPNLDRNEENVFGKQAANNWSGSGNELVINEKTINLFQPADLRLNFYTPNAFFGPVYPGGFLRKNGPGTIQFGLLVPDLYLLRAECKARGNDLPGAVTDLETLRIKRLPAADYPVPAGIAAQKLPLLKFIIDERIREFAVTGYRWFDMRRLSVDPLFGTTTFTHTLYSSTGTAAATFDFRPERFALRFPLKVINENPGMENNP